MNQTTEPPLETYTVEDIARMLQLSTRNVYRKCDNNEIPHFRVGGAIRFIRSRFHAWIDEQSKA